MAQIVMTLKKQFADNCTLDSAAWEHLSSSFPIAWEIAGVEAHMVKFQYRGGTPAGGEALVTFEVADNDVALLYGQAMSMGKPGTASVVGGRVEIVPRRPRGRPPK